MLPTRSDVRIDRPLTNLAVNYRPQAFGWVDELAPFFRVANETDKIWKINRQRISGEISDTAPDGLRSLRSEDGTAAALRGFGISTDNYRVEEYALNQILFDRIRDNADSALMLRNNLTEQLVEALRQDRAHRVRALVQTAGNYATPNTGAAAAAWDVAGTKTITDINTARVAIREATLGMATDDELTVTIGYTDWLQLIALNTDIQDRVKYVQTVNQSDITPAMVAAYWQVGKVVVAGSYFNTAGEGITESIAEIWGTDKAVISWNPPPSMVYKGFALSFTTRGGGFETRTWRDDPRKGEIIEPSMYCDEKIVNNDAAYLLTGLDT